jgi:hypothetical protein
MPEVRLEHGDWPGKGLETLRGMPKKRAAAVRAAQMKFNMTLSAEVGH